MSSTSESAESAASHSGHAQTGAAVHLSHDQIGDRVMQLANQSSDRSAFLRLLASELMLQFGSGIVAVEASHWANPMMLVSDDSLAQQIERAAITGLLKSATTAPIACDVPQLDEATVSRGLRIELTGLPERPLLLVYPRSQAPTAIEQVKDLQSLSLYADSTRKVVGDLAIPESERHDNKVRPGDAPTSMVKGSPAMGDLRSLRSFHRDLDLNATGYRIANESRRLIGCDRTTVLVPRHGRLRVSAVSGVSVVDRRSNSVVAMERLASAAVVLARPLVLPSEDILPPQIQEPLDDYLDQAGVMNAVLLPLHQPSSRDDDRAAQDAELLEFDPFDAQGDLVGVLVLEYFSGDRPTTIRPAMSIVAGEATLSLRNSLEHRNVFGLRLWKSVGTLASKMRSPIATMAAIATLVAVAAAMLIQVDHYVVATGKLEPTTRREVFASVDGIVKQLHVKDGQTVRAGQPLMELENAELESRAESVTGEMQTAVQRLASIASMRLSDEGDAAASSRIAMEERQLQSELENLRGQHRIIQAQQDALKITAPIDGVIVGWQLQQRLLDRPVSRGNQLVSVVDPKGDWSLRLNLPDQDAGPVLAAAEETADLPIEFAVATDPENTYAAKLESIATAARMDAAGEHILDATATVHLARLSDDSLDTFSPDTMRSGADVTAKIACGPRSLIRSWFSDVFDFVHRNVLFYF